MNTVDIYGDKKVIADIMNNDFSGEFVDDNLPNVRGSLFYDCTKLTRAKCPNATIIGIRAFENSGIQKVESTDFPSAVTIDQYAFENCHDLTEVSFPEATTLNQYAFSGCESLTDVSFPSVTTFGGIRIFEDCTSLREVHFPEVTQIRMNDSYIFIGCTSLEKVYFPKVTQITGTTSSCRVFNGCTSLEEILPTAFPVMTYFGQYGLNGLPNLKKVILPSLTTWGYRVIDATTAQSIQVLRTPKCGNGFSVDLLGATSAWPSIPLHLVDTNDSNIPADGLVASRYSASNLRTIILRNTAMVTLASATGRFVTATPLNANGNGVDIYVPQNLISEYEADTNWSVLGSNGYGTARFHALEGSIYEEPDYDNDIGMED